MSLQGSIISNTAIRHRIKEITLHPDTSKHRIALEISADGKVLQALTTVEPDQPLCWDVQTFPCDVRPESKIGLKFTKKYTTSSDSEMLVEYAISESTDQTSITRAGVSFPKRSPSFWFASNSSTSSTLNKPITVTIKFQDPKKAEHDYSAALTRARTIIETENGPLDRMGNARVVLKTILDFGGVVAELHPTAKLVVGLCAKAWEHLEKLQGQHDSLEKLIGGLAQLRPFIESVKSRAKDVLKDTIVALLYLIEDASNFIINYVSRMCAAARAIQSTVDNTVSDQITELLQRFEQSKENFSLGVGVQTLIQTMTKDQRALLDRLKPSAGAHYASTPPCQDGTRTEILDNIYSWCEDPDTNSKLLWLYGRAGMGKSSISSSVCRELERQKTLGSSFFCKRDDPQLRTPEQILNTLVYNLACQYQPYGQAVASAIEDNVQLPDAPLEQRYMHLVETPLKKLASGASVLPGTIVLVVDALDECENTDRRRLLLSYLRRMSQLVSWLKIVATSRPEQDIYEAFDNHSFSYDLANYKASQDILEYTRTRMAEMVLRKKQSPWSESSIKQLSDRADGLFIWVETACKFIGGGFDMQARLEQVLDGTRWAEGSEPLDQLYMTAILQGMADQKPDNVRIVRECIGAVVATASRTPLDVVSLESLLSSRLTAGVLRIVMNGLESVLYQDHTRGGVVRVYHPSFADFILDQTRSRNFHTDPEEQNASLADCCFRTMMRDLKFNICGLESSHKLNDDVLNLETRAQNAILPHLAYSCKHWADHLTKTAKGTLQDQLQGFLYAPQLLYWIEAMSLLHLLGVALSSLLGLVDWMSGLDESHSKYVNDMYRFLLTFHDAISDSTPHLYISALAFVPSGSKVAQHMRPLFPNTFTVANGANESFTPWLQTMSHNDRVTSTACSGDGRRIATGCGGGTVRIWDTETGAAASEPLASPGVDYVAISLDGRRVASGSYDGTLRVWDTETSASFGPLGSGLRDLISLAFSPDGQSIISGDGHGTVLFFNMQTKAESSRLHLNHSDRVLSTALSPDGQLIASCSLDGNIRFWNTGTGAPVTEPIAAHLDCVRCVVFSPNGRLLASGSDDNTVRLWNVSAGTAVGQPMTGHSYYVWSVAFSPNDRYLVSGSGDQTVRVWDVETCKPVCEPLVGHTAWVNSVAFCSNGRRVVSASNDHTVRIWDVVSGATTRKAPLGHSDTVSSVAFSSDGRYIASGSDDGTVRVWDAQTGEEAHKPMSTESGTVRCVAFISDSNHIVCLTGDEKVQVWEVEAGTMVREFSLGHSRYVSSIALSPDGRRIASGSYDYTVGLWDAETGASVFPPLAGHSYPVQCVSFSPNSRLVASCSWDRTIRIWDADTGIAVGEPLIGHSYRVRTVCFSPDSRRIASGSDDGTVRVWNVETGTALLEPLRGNSSYVYSVVFSPDGRHIISGSKDETVRIWNADTGAAIGEPLVGHMTGVNSVALSPDGHHIATGSIDKTVRIWNAKTNAAEPQFSIDDLLAAPAPLSLSSSFLARHANESGWVTSNDGALLLWLPKEHQRKDDSLVRISAIPLPERLVLDFSRFVHGALWACIAKA